MSNYFEFALEAKDEFSLCIHGDSCRESMLSMYSEYYCDGMIHKITLTILDKQIKSLNLTNITSFLQAIVFPSHTLEIVTSQSISITNKPKAYPPEPATISLAFFIMRNMYQLFEKECTVEYIISKLLKGRYYCFSGIPKARFRTAYYLYLCSLSKDTRSSDDDGIFETNGPADYVQWLGWHSDIDQYITEFTNLFPTECDFTLKAIRHNNFNTAIKKDALLEPMFKIFYPDKEIPTTNEWV